MSEGAITSASRRSFCSPASLYVCYIVSGILVKPDWKEAAIYSVKPVLLLDTGYITMLIGMVGTSIAPWMQFYPAGGGGGEGHHGEGICRIAHRGDRRLHRDVGDRVLHHRGVRGRDLIANGPRDIKDATDAAQALKPFGPVRLPAVLRGPVQRVGVRRLHPAALHRLFGLRRTGLRIGCEPAVQRSADLLLAVSPC